MRHYLDFVKCHSQLRSDGERILFISLSNLLVSLPLSPQTVVPSVWWRHCPSRGWIFDSHIHKAYIHTSDIYVSC